MESIVAEISIIIPVYNTAKYLEKCLESVFTQNFRDIEIICINDGSNDNSLQILQEYQKKDSRIVIINQPNQGVSAARNAGLAVAKGQYVLFLDGDDFFNEINPEEIQKYTSMDYDVLLFNFSILSSADYSLIENTSKKYVEEEKEHLIIDYISWRLKIQMGSFMVKNKMLQYKNHKFNEGQSYAEDVEFIVKMLYYAESVSVVAENINVYRIHSASAMGKVNFKRFESFFSRKRLMEFFNTQTEFVELGKVYKGYLLPESIIMIVELWARQGKNFWKLHKFMKKNNMADYLRNSNFNEYTPHIQKMEINKYLSSPMWYFCRKRLTELKYNVKALAYKKLKS